MPFIVTSIPPVGPVKFERETREEAVEKAAELLSKGHHDVKVSDSAASLRSRPTSNAPALQLSDKPSADLPATESHASSIREVP